MPVKKRMKENTKKNVMRMMLQISKLYQQSIYGWDIVKEKFMVSLTSPAFSMHVNSD